MYNVLSNGLVADDSTDNTSALNTLIGTVHAAGGGEIYFPAGNYRFLKDSNNKTILVTGRKNIVFSGDGKASRLMWNGTMSSAGNFFTVENGSQHIGFLKL